ncbi:MAG TPA: envelope stress response membrane protein PspB [Sphingobium sp.]|nr:envelope stress response membrane protein PspB [Sphingobium sp.]
MDPVWIPIIAIPTVLIALPWIVLHYVTQWKKSTAMTNEDEVLLDQMYETARRLEERLGTVERIIAADNPDFRALRGAAGDDYRLEGRN